MTGRRVSGPRLCGKCLLVTGAASGIGRAIVLRAVQEGAVVAALDVDESRLDQVMESLGEGRHVAVVADVCDEEAVGAALQQACDTIGRLDGLVLSAGVTAAGRTEDIPLALWDRVIRINLTGAFLTIKHALPYLRAAGGGSIVTIGSTASVVAAGRSPAYAASKGGLLQLTRFVAAEYARYDIRANCLCPSAVATELAKNSEQILGEESVTPNVGELPVFSAPIGKPSTAEDVARVATFLCSDESILITGSAIMVDQGMTAV